MSSDVREMIQQTGWELVGPDMLIGTAQAALTTDKSAILVDALAVLKRAIINAEDGAVAYEVRFRCDGTNDVADTLNLYAMAGNSDDYTLMGTLTITNGTQIGGDYTYYDTITIANELWIDDIIVLSDANNGIARFAFNTQGYRKFLLIATTLNNTAVYVEYRRVG